MLAEGRTWTEIEAETGMFRQPYVEAAYVLDDFEGFTEAERAQKACIGARIAGRAMDCAFAGVKTRTRTKTDIDGKVERETVEERYADPAFARIAGEYSDPATGRRDPPARRVTHQPRAAQVTRPARTQPDTRPGRRRQRHADGRPRAA
jgi:hypothetical protein